MTAVQAVLIVLLAPLLQGFMQKVRARLCGRPGASVLQPYRDLRKLFSKEAVVAASTSALVLAAPGVALGCALTIALLVPAFPHAARVDAFALALTLALGRFVLVLAALDSRSNFGGMSASREMLFAGLTEAPLILAIASAALLGSALAQIFAVAAILLVLLSEIARVPVDNQETHYELTMIHEGLVLEYSGWHLCLLHAASYIRQAALLVLAAALMPGSGDAFAGWLALFVLMIPAIERRFAKLRLFEVPQLFGTATLLAAASIGIRMLGIGAW